jgi:hypothetical protein
MVQSTARLLRALLLEREDCWELSDRARRQSWADLDPGAAAAANGLARHKMGWMTDRQVNLTWRPTVDLDYPQEAERMRPWGQPPLEPRMRVTWSIRRQDGTVA